MKEYIAITKLEKNIIIIAIVFYMLINFILCFKGMKLMVEYKQLEQEKQQLEELVEVYREQLEGI